MNFLKEWWQDRKIKEQERITDSIRMEFEVVEKGGFLFLTHNGVAFDQIDKDTPAREIAMRLNTARDTAQKFRMQ